MTTKEHDQLLALCTGITLYRTRLTLRDSRCVVEMTNA
jgi:hypothetical protein